MPWTATEKMISCSTEMRKYLAVLLFFAVLIVSPMRAEAAEVSKMGIHVMRPEELDNAKTLINYDDSSDQWHYITIPYTLKDLDEPERWEKFFKEARQQKIIPIVRLATEVQGINWITPNRKNVVDQLNMLSRFDWPTDRKHIIIFNEVNHAAEWGGRTDPEDYASMFRFASNWARAIDEEFVVLPAAMDLAAPNGSSTMEAFTYLNRMYAYDKEIFQYADAWNSHSYPNPGFASAPSRNAKNALNGFEYELGYLADKTDSSFEVFITETGWSESNWNRRWLPSYYSYAIQHVWSHPQVVAVTPFILQGSPGPFSNFSFINSEGKPTAQYNAFRSALEKFKQEKELLLSALP